MTSSYLANQGQTNIITSFFLILALFINKQELTNILLPLWTTIYTWRGFNLNFHPYRTSQPSISLHPRSFFLSGDTSCQPTVNYILPLPCICRLHRIRSFGMSLGLEGVLLEMLAQGKSLMWTYLGCLDVFSYLSSIGKFRSQS